jgi:phytoene synthase
MTTPGPGVPPAMVSGIVAAQLLHDKLQAGEQRGWIDYWYKSRQIFRAIAAETEFSVYLAGCLLLSYLLYACGCMRFRFAWPSASQWACLRLFYGHGSTFFAASTLMSWRAFWDTTALYALFRAADDHVDQIGVLAADRRAGLARFERAFWRGLNGDDEGDASVDPILPAVIETCRRLQYPPALFEKFFASMRADCARDDGAFECHDMDETCRYMEGSAAVIGEFMLPILLNGSESALGAVDEAALRDAARALGNAFQLTNMIRDVEEDRALNRIYLPGGIVSGDRDKIERAIATADSYYAIADRGIARLPSANGARDVVRLARFMYASIHDAIRGQDYDLHWRARVSESAKLKLAWRHLGAFSTVQLACTHIFARLVALLLHYWAPLAVLAAAVSAPLYAKPELSYAQFHYVFTLPALAVLWAASALIGVSSNPNQVEHVKRFFCWSLGMCLVATVYTTPWDNALVWSGVWSYPSERPIWGLLGWVPIEEYAFFSIETLMVAGTLLAALPFKSVQSPPTRREPTPIPNRTRHAFRLCI